MDKSSFPAISVVIPVKNEVSKIKSCIEGILEQTITVKEIIVIDSGSTDGTIDILKLYDKVKLIQILPEEFNHGETRNLGVQHATGDYIVLTVGDALPYNKFWIEELVKGFIDKEVIGVCGQQVVPHDKDKNPADWFHPISEPKLIRYQYKNMSEFENLSPVEKKTICGWDDVNAMYLRSALLEIPFQRTSYSEDAIWAKEAIMKGYAIVYNYKARVFHYHLENGHYTFKRSFTTMYFRYKLFGYIPPAPVLTFLSRLKLLRLLILSLGINLILIIKWLNYNQQRYRTEKKVHEMFRELLKQGEKILDQKHEEMCGKPPIPLKAM